MPVIGFLSSNRADAIPQFTAAFLEGLSAAGFVDAKTLLSNTIGPTHISSGFLRLRSIWFGAGLTCFSPAAVMFLSW
jgi:hypothetical protein